MTISRRRFLANSTAAGAATMAAMTFGLPAARAQSADGVISIALASARPNGVNPQQTGLAGGDNWTISQVFQSLSRAEPGTFAVTPEDFQPSLAESWESSEDAKTWTFHLRKGVQFHKGYGEMTADDVLFTYGRQLDPEAVTNGKVLFANIANVEAPDSHTVVFTLKRPDPLFNGSTAVTLPASIISKKAWEEKGEEAFKFDPIGTGPYMVESADDTGVMLTANDQYWEAPAATKNVRVSFIADTTARTLAFASGQVDMIEGVRQPGWIPTMLQRDPNTIIDATKPGSFNHLHIALNKPPLDDLKIRQAIRYAINNEQLAAAFGPELSTPIVGVIASQFAGAVTKDELPEELRYDPDPEKAKALLAEAGYPDGLTIKAFTSQREDYSTIMLMIQEQLRAANITLDLDIIDHNTMHSENRSDKNTLALNSSSFPPVPTQPLLQLLSAAAEVKPDGSGQGNYSHYGVAIPGIDALLEQVQDEPDFDKRIALVKECELQVLRDLPMLGIITLSYVIARNPRIDLGYEVKSGYAYWPLHLAKIV
jgi:peptide/nickel transport system substrate-binding protein